MNRVPILNYNPFNTFPTSLSYIGRKIVSANDVHSMTFKEIPLLEGNIAYIRLNVMLKRNLFLFRSPK